MTNNFDIQIDNVRDMIKDSLPFGFDTTSDLMLDVMSHSKDEYVKDMATYINVSRKLPEIKELFDFTMSMLRRNPIPIREQIYDNGIDGMLEVRNHLAEKYGKDECMKKNEVATNMFNWLILKLPAKQGMKSLGLIYS